MKFIYILIVTVIFVHFTLLGQQKSRLDSPNIKTIHSTQPDSLASSFIKEERPINGFIVRLIKVPGGVQGYQFDVLDFNRSLVHRFSNPMPFKAEGIQNKEDAYKIAAWFIKDFKLYGRWQNIITPNIARELIIQSR